MQSSCNRAAIELQSKQPTRRSGFSLGAPSQSPEAGKKANGELIKVDVYVKLQCIYRVFTVCAHQISECTLQNGSDGTRHFPKLVCQINKSRSQLSIQWHWQNILFEHLIKMLQTAAVNSTESFPMQIKAIHQMCFQKLTRNFQKSEAI